MPTKTLYINAATGRMSIGNYGLSEEQLADPQNNLSSLNFHSDLPYLQIKTYMAVAEVTFPAVARTVITWDDGGKGGGCF